MDENSHKSTSNIATTNNGGLRTASQLSVHRSLCSFQFMGSVCHIVLIDHILLAKFIYLHEK